MNNSKYYLRFSVIMFISLFLSLSLFAQRDRGYHRNSYDHHHENNYNHYSHYPGARVSVNFGPRYDYHPYYRPRPVYRSPYTYRHFGPAFGLRINLLPIGFSRIYVGSAPYYYDRGVYYRPYSNGGYEVIAPPLGATVSQLPPDASVTVIDGQKYYQLGGTFYQEEISGNNELSYRVVGIDGVINTDNTDQSETTDNNNNDMPAIGSRYDVLPADSKVEVINQHKYFVSPGGIYYQEVIEGNKVRYEVTTVQ